MLNNSRKVAADVTLLFTRENSVGGLSEFSGQHSNPRIMMKDGVHGVLLHHKIANGQTPYDLCNSSRGDKWYSLSKCPCFLISGNS
jgi:non-lysosomal glucosylceramidase